MKKNLSYNNWYLSLAYAIITLLVSCGGSGGSDDPDIIASKEQIVISNSNVTLLADGGETTITVSANCSWSVSIESEDANWLTVNPKSGVNAGSFTIRANENPSESERTATLTVGGKTLTRTLIVTQRGRAITMSLDVTSLNFNVNGEAKSFNISSNTTWTIEAPEWCVLSANSGSNNKEITVTVAQNTTGAERTGVIVVNSQSGRTAQINVKQDGGKKPEITNLQLNNPSSNSVDFSFNLTASPTATEYGVYYSDTKETPTEEDHKESGTLTNGVVKGSISNLEQNKTYYIRAYAKNVIGTVYSEVKEFKTSQNVPGSDDNKPPTP